MKTFKLNNVEISENELRELIKANPELAQEPKKGRWRAEKGGEYYIFSLCLPQPLRMTELNEPPDDRLYALGNYFQTEELAQKASDRQLALTRLRDYALQYMPFEPDWENVHQNKYSIFYNHEGNFFDWREIICIQENTELPHFKSEEDVEKFINDNETDLKIVWGIK